MQVSLETTSGLERKMTIGIPSSVVDSEVEKRLKNAAKTVRIDGFRKGKVPLKIVKQRYGAGVRQEVLGDTINKSFYEAVQKESLKPAGQPSIEPKNLTEGSDIEFIATFEVFPEIELQKLDDLSVKRMSSSVTDTDVDTMIETLRKGQATWHKVERQAKEGDQVNIDFEGKRDGESFEGGSAQGQDLELGSNKMIPGFEDAIAGLSAGDEKSVELTFPEDYQAEDLRGITVEFCISVNSVSEQQLPELDEAFFTGFGVDDGDLDSFRKSVRENMDRELVKALRVKAKAAVLSALADAHEVEIPSSLVKNEIRSLRQQMVQQYGGAADNLDFDKLLPDNMFKDRAEQRTKLGLLINTIVSKEQIKVDSALVRSLIDEQASSYEQPEEVVNYYYSNEQMLANIEAAALEEQVVNHLLGRVKVEEVELSYDEAVKPQQ